MTAFNSARYHMSGEIADISTASAVRIPVPDEGQGYIEEIAGVLGGAVTGSNATVTVSNSGTTIGTLTVTASGSAEGDTVTLVPTNDAAFVASGDYLKIATDGGSTNTVPWGFSLRINRAAPSR